MQSVNSDPRLEMTYQSPKGSVFKICVVDGRLYSVDMLNGGIKPSFCNEKYTSFSKAKAALDKYFRNNPKPEPREKKKKD